VTPGAGRGNHRHRGHCKARYGPIDTRYHHVGNPWAGILQSFHGLNKCMTPNPRSACPQPGCVGMSHPRAYRLRRRAVSAHKTALMGHPTRLRPAGTTLVADFPFSFAGTHSSSSMTSATASSPSTSRSCATAAPSTSAAAPSSSPSRSARSSPPPQGLERSGSRHMSMGGSGTSLSPVAGFLADSLVFAQREHLEIVTP